MATIFLHDDDPDVVELIRAILRYATDVDHTLIATSDDGLDPNTYDLADVDVILLDIMLKNEPSGIEWAREIRSRFDGRIIGFSASDLLVQLAWESGYFDVVLGKPFDVARLVSVIEGHDEVPHVGE